MTFHKVSEKVVRPQELCFTQEIICVTFKRPREEERIDDAADLIILGRLSPKAFPKMNVVEFQDRLWSLDNRRLWVFKKAEVNFVTVTIVAYDFAEGFHSLASTSPFLYYTMSRPDFFPRVRGYCKETFTDEDPDLPSSPLLPPTPHVRVRASELHTKIRKHSRPSSAPISDPKPDTHPKRPNSPSPSKVTKVSSKSKHTDCDHHRCRHHHDVPSRFKTQSPFGPSIPGLQGSVVPPPSQQKGSPDYGPSHRQSKKRPYETELHHSRSHHGASSPPPAKRSRDPYHQARDFNSSSPAPSWMPNPECASPRPAQKLRAPTDQVRDLRTSTSSPKPPVAMTPLQSRPKAPRPLAKQVRAPSPPRKTKAPQPVMKARTVTRSSERSAEKPGNLPSSRTTEPKVSRSSGQPCRAEPLDKRPALLPLSKDRRAQRGREASSTSRTTEEPPPPSAPKRTRAPKPTSCPPNFSYDFHSSRKRSKASKGSKKTAASTTSTSLNDPQIQSSASPKNRHPTSEACTSKMPPAPLPSLSTTVRLPTVPKTRDRDDNYTSGLSIPSVPAPKSPPVAPEKKSNNECHGSSSCPDPSENHHHHSRQESPGLVDSEIMTETERDLFMPNEEEPADDTELPLPLTPCKELSSHDRKTLDAIVELFLRDAKSPLQQAQLKPTAVETQKEPIETVISPHQLPSPTTMDEVGLKQQQDEVDVPRPVVECPVQYDGKGKLFESTLKGFRQPTNPPTKIYRDGDVHRATGNVGVTVTAGLELPEPKASTPVNGRVEQEIPSKSEGNATDLQQKRRASLARGGFQEMARTANNDVSVRLMKSVQLNALPKSGNEVPEVPQRITRSQIKKQKEMERRKARERRREERKAKAEKEGEVNSTLREKSQSAPKNITTEIVPYDPERIKEASSGARNVQSGDMVYVKVNAQFTGSDTEGRKGGPRSNVRLHPYLRIIGPFRVERRFSVHAAVLDFPDDCDLRRIVGMQALLKSRSPLDINFLSERRISVRLEPETILNKRVARRLKKHKVLHYLVKWKQLPATEATWEPEDIFDVHPHLLDHIDSPLFANPYLLRNWRV